MQYELDAGCLTSDGQVLFRNAHESTLLDTRESGCGAFLRVSSQQGASRQRFGLGRMPGLVRFVACHRYEPYWMKPTVGKGLAEVPPETQCLVALLDNDQVLFLVPLLDEPVRFSLRGKKDDSLELLAETGDAHTPGHGGAALWLAVGADPFELAKNGARVVAEHLGSGPLRAEKPLPDFADVFGWCTWDAFYQEVSADKVFLGLEAFRRGGVSPRMMILDDGWQSTRQTLTGEKRLTAFEANDKFPGGLAPTTRRAKDEFGIQSFLVWHTVVGYWGGVDGEALSGYGVIDQARHFGEGVLAHEPTFNNDWWGSLVGYVPTHNIARFYDDYHSYLASEGVDGVKVDSQAVLEALTDRQGGRVGVSRAYRKALEASVGRHFGGALINCMSNAQETYYFSPASNLLRTSIDFFPTRPESHGMHLYANAQVGVWFGEFMHPDWDMFQSGHEWGAFHAAARAVSGGPVYVSDKPGEHDFALLEKLVTSEGRVLRADRPGLPTRKVLFRDPTQEPVLFEVWTRNGAAGFLGVFNCRFAEQGEARASISGAVSPSDVPGLSGERFACFSHRGGRLSVLGPEDCAELSLAPGEFELFTLVPIEGGFAAVGLSDKFNSHGAVRATRFSGGDSIEIELEATGSFLAHSERAPLRVEWGSTALEFEYDAEARRLSVEVPPPMADALRVRFG